MGDPALRDHVRREHEWRDFSEIAGPISPVDDAVPYRVGFTNLQAADGKFRFVRSIAIAVANLLLEALFFGWLLQPGHLPPLGHGWAVAADVFVISSIALMELLRLINVVSLSLASIVARDPIPVTPQQGMRVAFVTTIVPGKEPIGMVRRTLIAAKRIRYAGELDIWLLDEGDDPAVRAMCTRLGVHHFSRKGRAVYNRPSGAFKAKTKHGNYNAWLHSHGSRYAVMMSVDPDHTPLPNYAERILGYFRDPSIAYVVGPQCYANCDNLVTKAAESQQFPFHSVIQRAANRYGVAMLVGTNNAIRISAIQGVGGLSDSITEDMATGLKIHTARNPATGRRWRSVYTPDVLAIGEGPSSWSDYFSQQLRWSRGTFEVLLTDFWKRCWRLSPGRLLHYGLITTFYPSMALGWVLGGVNALLFLAFGVRGINVPVQLWLALYTDATAFQIWLYIRNRRHNVSPSELEGTSGIRGMLLSILTSPIYSASLVAALLRLPARFVVTAKGASTSTDTLITFRRHLQWAVLLAGALVTSFVLGYAALESCLWPAISLLVCLTPIALWLFERRRPTSARPSRRAPTRTELMRQETRYVEALR
jgi:cellulose synthase/poly-beta-1,6-N-acetylglucosamine synthase-like glycosyltransferase